MSCFKQAAALYIFYIIIPIKFNYGTLILNALVTISMVSLDYIQYYVTFEHRKMPVTQNNMPLKFSLCMSYYLLIFPHLSLDEIRCQFAHSSFF